MSQSEAKNVTCGLWLALILGCATGLHFKAKSYTISLLTVFCELRRYVQAHGLPPLRVQEKDIHVLRDTQPVQSVSRTLFGRIPPQTADYMAVTQDVFQSPFMPSLKRMIKQHGTSASYIQQIMDIPMADALALHAELCS